MDTTIKLKSSIGLVKDVDMKGRIVTGYFSTWGYDSNGMPLPDSDGDVMQKGAFTNTVNMNGPMAANRIWHLFNHDTGKPLNKPYVLKEDETGLYFETKFPDTKLANDILTLYKEGAITEHSIGYNVIQSRNENNYNVLQEVRLWEGSSVLWGANQVTPTTGIKAEEYGLKASILNELLHDGNLSDETFLMIEKMLQDIKDMFRAGTTEPEQPETKEPTSDPEGLVLNFYKQLNK